VEFNPSLVVLVAPALEGVALPSSSRGKKLVSGTSSRDTTSKRIRGSISNKLSQVGVSIWVTCRKLFFHHPFRFGLRRLVGGTPNFWKKGLASAWGDPKRLSESDVLRFQWPSIGIGWEQGLLNLVRHKLSSSASSSAVLNDEQLLHQVSNMKDTKVVIIYGSKDRIVRFEGAVAEKVKQEFPNCHLVRMEGLGHDPFEEDVDGFLTELKAVC
jgi:pimeloyl-ACP methyl ester carboxylesterase